MPVKISLPAIVYITLVVMALSSHPVTAGREVTNREGRLNRTYHRVLVKEAGDDKATIAENAKATVKGKTVWLYLPGEDKPRKTRALLFYDWGYQLEITVYDNKHSKRLICICPLQKEEAP